METKTSTVKVNVLPMTNKIGIIEDLSAYLIRGKVSFSYDYHNGTDTIYINNSTEKSVEKYLQSVGFANIFDLNIKQLD
jgi:hypothetical protein